MSREMQLYSSSNLPATQEDLLHGTTLGMPSAAAGAPSASPVKKLQRLLRGREKLAIVLALLCAVLGALIGWNSQQTRYVSNGMVWIRPIIPRLLDSDKVMPFYNFFVQSQTAFISGPRVLERAVQTDDWKATGLPAGSESVAQLKQDLTVTYPKNSQHILVSYTDEKPEVAQRAVRAVIQSYASLYSDANGQEMKSKLSAIEIKKDTLESAITGVNIQIQALTEKHGSNDLSVVYNESMRHLIELKDRQRSAQLKLDSARQGMPKEGESVDPTKGLTVEQIAMADGTMRKYIQELEIMQFNLERMGRNVGSKSPVYVNAVADIDMQKRRIETYATSFRKMFTGGNYFNSDTGQITALTTDMLRQLEMQASELKKQLDKDTSENQTLNQDWSKMLELKQNHERLRSEKEKYDREYDEEMAQAAMGGTLKVVSDGDTPVPAADKRKQFAFVGFVGGGLAPIALLVLIGLLDGKMRYSEEAGSEMSGMTLLGILPNLPDRLTDPTQAATAAHCVHQIRTMLQINSGDDRNVFAVTSASPGDGKTSLTLALGLSFAASGSRTLLIDCDLVGAGLTSRLDMTGPDGVLEAMSNRELLPYIRTTDIADLAMLPVGQAQAHHAGMFSPQALRRLINEAKKHFEIILIDSGPVLGSIEATPVCAAADGVILTVSRGQQRPLVEKAMQHLQSIGARFAGVVFNRAQAKDFARSISGISLRSIARQHQAGTAMNGGTTNGNGGPHKPGAKAFGPVARAVATSVKPPEEGL